MYNTVISNYVNGKGCGVGGHENKTGYEEQTDDYNQMRLRKEVKEYISRKSSGYMCGNNVIFFIDDTSLSTSIIHSM